MRAYSNWQWHLDEVFVKTKGKTHYLWRAVDHEGEVLESFVRKRRDRRAALKFLRRTIKRHGRPHIFVTDKLRSYGAAMKLSAIVRSGASHAPDHGPSVVWTILRRPQGVLARRA
jgi:transposase-like protein